MGVSVHIELRDFLLTLSYPRGYTCEECVQAAYDRGYKETLQTAFRPDEKGGFREEVSKRIERHMQMNYDMLKHRFSDDPAIFEREEHGKTVFNEPDKKAYFVPGKDERTVRAWATHSTNPVDVAGYLIQYLDEKRFPTYEELSHQSHNGWDNHYEMMTLFYLDKFPGKNLLDIIKEYRGSIAREEETRLRKKFKAHLDGIESLRAPVMPNVI
jgi:hypothetical protein